MKNYIKQFRQKNDKPVCQVIVPDPGPNGVLISPDGINWRVVNATQMNSCVTTEQKSDNIERN